MASSLGYAALTTERLARRANARFVDLWSLGGIGSHPFRIQAIDRRYHLSDELYAVEGILAIRGWRDGELVKRAGWLRKQLGWPCEAVSDSGVTWQ